MKIFAMIMKMQRGKEVKENLKKKQQEEWMGVATNDILPKHLLRFVFLSMKTFALRIVPNGRKVWIRSASVNSGGKW